MIPRCRNENIADGTELLVRDVRCPVANGGEPDMARTAQFGRERPKAMPFRKLPDRLPLIRNAY
jgi:hypothetical protein